MQFHNWEVTVAYSMLELAEYSPPKWSHLFQQYMCYWVAFNNIYTTLGDRNGKCAIIRYNPDGTLKTDKSQGFQFVKVDVPRERDLLDLAFDHFSKDLKHDLIMHESTRYLVDRIPRLNGKEVQTDAFGQILNGVMNVGRSLPGYPSYSPIDRSAYQEYLLGSSDASIGDRLAKQILEITYTVRNNLFHGGKRSDDAHDKEVVEKALPLLKMIVLDFLADIKHNTGHK